MRPLLIAFGWVATVAAAFVLGRTTGEGGAPPERAGAVVRPVEAPADADPGPACSPRARRRPGPAGSPAATARRSAREAGPFALRPGETLEPFTLEDVTYPDVAMSADPAARRRAARRRGEDGHLELLHFLDEHVVQNKDLERLFEGSEEQMARYIVPMIEFMVHRKGQVLGVIETVFETMAERPQVLAEIRRRHARDLHRGRGDHPAGRRRRGAPREVPRVGQAAARDARRVLARAGREAAAAAEAGPAVLGSAPQRRRCVGPAAGRARCRAARPSRSCAACPPEQLAGVDVAGDPRARDRRRWTTAPCGRSGTSRSSRRDVDLLDRTVLDAAAAGKARDWAVDPVPPGHPARHVAAPQMFLEEGFRRGGRRWRPAPSR